jgi:hypothetical protein
MDERRRETTLVLDKKGLKKITNLLLSHEILYCYANSEPIIVKFEHLAKVFDLACYYPEELVCFAFRLQAPENEENDMNEDENESPEFLDAFNNEELRLEFPNIGSKNQEENKFKDTANKTLKFESTNPFDKSFGEEDNIENQDNAYKEEEEKIPTFQEISENKNLYVDLLTGNNIEKKKEKREKIQEAKIEQTVNNNTMINKTFNTIEPNDPLDKNVLEIKTKSYFDDTVDLTHSFWIFIYYTLLLFGSVYFIHLIVSSIYIEIISIYSLMALCVSGMVALAGADGIFYIKFVKKQDITDTYVNLFLLGSIGSSVIVYFYVYYFMDLPEQLYIVDSTYFWYMHVAMVVNEIICLLVNLKMSYDYYVKHQEDVKKVEEKKENDEHT